MRLPTLILALVATSHAAAPPLLPRAALFGNPARSQPQLSPDGQRLAWLQPDAKGVLQVWVGNRDGRLGRGAGPLTHDPKRGIRRWQWAPDNKAILYFQDTDGDENWHLHGVDVATGKDRDYTPLENVQAQLVAADPGHPDEVLVALNDRDPAAHDVKRLKLSTGALTLVARNPGDVLGWTADADFQVRGATVQTPDGGTELRVRDTAAAGWRTLLKLGADETLSLDGFSGDGRRVILTTSQGRDTARVVERDLATGEETQLAADPGVDPGDVLVNPRTHRVEAVAFADGRSRWTALAPEVKRDFQRLATAAPGDLLVLGRDAADRTWLVAYDDAAAPLRYYRWDRPAQKLAPLFSQRPALDQARLAPMAPVSFPARDGLKLSGYLTLPPGRPPGPGPLVLYVHGGPWARDAWGFEPTVQWLANRGYAVLQVNFRGSTGYGKRHLNAGNKQWGKRMNDDLVDAVGWAVARGVADPKRVGIFGGSYGGYATLAGLAYTPDVFACGVDIVGPANLRTLLGTIPPYWKPMRAMLMARVADLDDPADDPLIASASPVFSAGRIRKPLLIAQGANDPRVKQDEAEQIVKAIAANGGRATYVLYPDEGHGFARPANRLDFHARAEAFLAEVLGGRYEKAAGEREPGSTAVVKVVGK